jgi:hypothetical protein
MVPIFQPPHTSVSGLKPMVGCGYLSRIGTSAVVENPKFISVEIVSTSFYICSESLWSVPELDGLLSEISEPSPLVLEVFFSFAPDHFWRKSPDSPWTFVVIIVVVVVAVVIVSVRPRSLRALLTQRQGESANSDSRSHHIFETLPTHPLHHRFTPSTKRSI